MDLGIRGKSALVCGASKGLGRGCAESLAREGCIVTIVARDAAQITQAARDIAAMSGSQVIPVAADITTPEGRAAALKACPNPDILVTNAGGPPPGHYRDLTREQWVAALNANMLTPIDLIQATIDGMISRRFGRIVNITSSTVKAPIEILGLSNGARAGLTGFVAGVARTVAKHNVTINGLLPGFFDTDRIRGVLKASAAAKKSSEQDELSVRTQSIPAGRIGDPAEFGEACAFLCSVQAGYITGQNLLIDGGAYPGTL